MRCSHVLSILVLMIVLACFPVDCLKCYVCHTKNDESCEEKLDKNYIVTCPTNATKSCRKTVQYLYFVDPYEYQTLRECSNLDENSCTQKTWREVYIHSCTCQEDECNKSTSLGPTWKMTVAVVILRIAVNFLHTYYAFLRRRCI